MDSKNGYYEKASINLSEAKENAPRQDSMLLFQIHYHLGELYKLRRDQQASIESYQKAIEYHSPQNKYSNYEMGDCLLNTRQYAAARTYYKKARAKRFEFTGFGKCGLPHVADRYFLFEHTKYSECNSLHA